MPTLNVKFPQSQKIGKDGTLTYNSAFTRKFNENLNDTQIYLDTMVGTYLQDYVSYKTGTQMKSIILTNTYGKGYVLINVPYAEYQAYSTRIKKRVGKRGTRPFERMKADKKDSILKQTEAYARRINE